ncbi:hypothetical protein VNO80_17597 [Phaseolus coccineus]|uniref:Uncharacterized protein n=1 Tax=Phaseolus coccineus TaxID=3886 RepID=A0AAN9MG26_PHACN
MFNGLDSSLLAKQLLARVLQYDNFDLVDPRLQKNYDADEMIVGVLEGVVSLSDLVGDVTLGHTTVHNWSNYLDYGANQDQQDFRSFDLALSSQKYSSSGYIEITSACGLTLLTVVHKHTDRHTKALTRNSNSFF